MYLLFLFAVVGSVLSIKPNCGTANNTTDFVCLCLNSVLSNCNSNVGGSVNLVGLNISFIANKTFKNCSKILAIDLSQNSITRLQANVFDGLLNVTVLHLRTNSLTLLQESVLSSLPKLRHLTLNNNNISYISSRVFAFLPKLQNLHLHNNRITKRDYKGLADLKVLTVGEALIDVGDVSDTTISTATTTTNTESTTTKSTTSTTTTRTTTKSTTSTTTTRTTTKLTTTTTTTSTAANTSSSDASDLALVIGLSVGGLILIILVFFLSFKYCKCKKQKYALYRNL